MSEGERWRVRLKNTNDGGDKGIVSLPPELLAQNGLTIGDELIIEVVNGVITLQPLHNPTTRDSSSGTLRSDEYRSYRLWLETHLQIPTDASAQAIHELIESGFSASSLQALCDQGIMTPAERDRVIPYRTLKTRLANNQRLRADESDRMYRAVHVIAMAIAVFGDTEKARHWLSKPKSRFSGKSPSKLLSTSLGTNRVEEMLIQVAEGLNC